MASLTCLPCVTYKLESFAQVKLVLQQGKETQGIHESGSIS